MGFRVWGSGFSVTPRYYGFLSGIVYGSIGTIWGCVGLGRMEDVMNTSEPSRTLSSLETVLHIILLAFGAIVSPVEIVSLLLVRSLRFRIVSLRHFST